MINDEVVKCQFYIESILTFNNYAQFEKVRDINGQSSDIRN